MEWANGHRPSGSVTRASWRSCKRSPALPICPTDSGTASSGPKSKALLGRPYTRTRMTYDLRRLRLKGVIHRIPNTHRHTATTYASKSRSSVANSISASLAPPRIVQS